MATRRTGAQSRPAGAAVKPKDKGTRGGRPEAQPVIGQGRAQGGNRPASNRGRPSATARQESNGPASPGKSAQAKRAETAVDVNGSAATPEPAGSRVPLWFRVTTFVLSLLGLADSIWVTIDHYTPVPLGCSDKGGVNCAEVLHSPQSVIFGVPLPILGLAFFVFLIVVNSPWGWRIRWPAFGTVRLASIVVGMLFVLYLVYTELITIGAICLYCTGVHIVTFLLFALTMFAISARYIDVELPKRR